MEDNKSKKIKNKKKEQDILTKPGLYHFPSPWCRTATSFISSDLRLQNVWWRFQTMFPLVFLALSYVRACACVCRHSRGGWRRWLAAEVRGWVLVVPSHVEPHAAASLPQRVLAARADGPQQGICPGEIPAETSACTNAHEQLLLLSVLCFLFFSSSCVGPFNQLVLHDCIQLKDVASSNCYFLVTAY